MCAMTYRIDPLNADNYSTWKLQMRAILIKNDSWQYVDGTVVRPTEGELLASWKKHDEKACADITLSVAPSELGLITDCETSRDIWLKLESTFQSKGPAKKATLLKRIALSSLKDGDCVREHLNEYFDAVKKLKEIGVEIGDELLAILLLYSLPYSFETFRVALETRDEIPKPDILRVKILEEYESRKAKEERVDQNALLAQRNPHYQKSKFESKRNNNSKKNVVCFKCGKSGHFAKQCKAKQRQNSDKQPERRDTVFYSTEITSLCDTTAVCCLDSGCTSHMCANPKSFEHIQIENKTLHLANDKTAQIKGTGSVKFNVHGQHQDIKLNEVLYVEDLRTNLLSVSKITDKDFEVRFNKFSVVIINTKTKKQTCVAERIGNLYYIKEDHSVAKFTNFEGENTIDVWHKKMGHLNEKDIKQIISKKLAHGMSAHINQKLSPCEICLSEKQARNHFHKSSRQTADLLDIVHSDVCGPMRVSSFSGAKYFVTFIDDKSRWCQLYFLKNKSDVFEVFKTFKAEAELHTGRKIKALQSDNGGEYCSKEFKLFLEACGIERRFSAPHTPQQNGVAERKNRTLIEMARCMLKQSGAPPAFWAEAVNTACYIRNRCPTRSLEGTVPYTVWTNKLPILAHMQVFGTKAYVLNKTLKNKLESRSSPCIFVGYASNAKAYRLWDPKRRDVIISRDVKFTKTSGFYNEKENVKIQDPNNCVDILYEPNEPHVYEPPQEESDQYFDNEQHGQPTARGRGRPQICRTGRPGRPKKMYQLPQTQQSQQEQAESDASNDSFSENEIIEDEYESANLTVYDDPNCLSDALKSEEADSWLKALHNEYVVQLKNKTWEIVERPPKRKIIGSRLVFKTKEDRTKKVRLVAKGCAQRPGIDYFEVFSPVVRPASVRLVVALSVEMKLQIHQMDVVAAYLNGELRDEVYMEVPDNLKVFLEEYVSKNANDTEMSNTAKRWIEAYRQFPNGVCVIKKALYGLRQSGLRWYEKLSKKLTETGLKASNQDLCLFIDRKDDDVMLVAVYVDDLLIASNNDQWIKSLKEVLSATFDMKDLGHVKNFLGVEFKQVLRGGDIIMTQHNYITLILKRFDMLDCKGAKTPIESKCDLRRPDYADQSYMEKHPYQRLIGSLMYLSVTTRPDISFAVTYLSQFNTAYGPEHWTAAKRILRYLKGTINFGLLFQKTGHEMYGVADADWASDANGRKSYSGIAFIFGGAAISWEARKQRTVALSSTEAEYIALTEATKEAMYLKDIMQEVGLQCEKVTLYNDSQSAQKLIRSVGYHARTKHIDTRHHFIKEKLDQGIIDLEYMSTEDMPADVLTKGLTATKHSNCLKLLGVKQTT